MRRAARIDSTHGAIVDALRNAGCSVQSLARVGDGAPDLLVGFRGCNWLLEVKRDDGPPSIRKLNPEQVDWHRTWRGMVAVVHTPEEALAVVGLASR